MGGALLHQQAVSPISGLSAWVPGSSLYPAMLLACTLPALASTSDRLGQASVGAQTRVGVTPFTTKQAQAVLQPFPSQESGAQEE